MNVLVNDPDLAARLRAEREGSGADRYDEVWEGVYVMPPLPNDDHQDVVTNFSAIFQHVLGWPGEAQVRPGINLSDREHEWQYNYRVPDVAVFLKGTAAVNAGTHWIGAADFLIEVLGSRDQARDKIPFYEAVGVRELSVVDREPWKLELYRLEKGRLQLTGESCLDHPSLLQSQVLQFQFRLTPGAARPVIAVTYLPSQESWLV